ncbi:peptide chain release factor N(5)-glutamine methyltransferase [Psychrobacter sp. SCQQ22]|uniref:peptide chain release factor N(5)-glutamine methyltransferase n=1 Tax=unclassified Psychrobacter TaxID=196806 RepID=UPI0018CEB8E8|nr:peptide chain release factor N(5)-glutamine methyltransferase [Psychrobacter sp. SCQQ22]MBH0085242.1 peptide chain release factor N(5)-glutamine methyltransferase [Psychrobacter sp. SCQQ22]
MTASNIRQIKQHIQQWMNEAENSKLPSFWLTDWLLYVVDKPAIALMTDEGYQLTDSEFEQFNAGVAKMQAGIPLAYLTGQQEFWSLTFTVNEHTLIPRPDTEVLIEQVLGWINTQSNRAGDSRPKRLLDLGTGSGCIAISLAHELKQANWQVVAVDLSSEALNVAQHNAVSNNVANIEFIQSSWYDSLPTDDSQRFDVIVSNPPYIDEEDEHLARLIAEPISALSSPNQGLSDIEHIVQTASQYLRVGGLLAIEHGFDQGVAIRQLFLDNGFESVHTVKDYGDNDRVTLGQI